MPSLDYDEIPDADERSFEALPEGWYLVTVEEVRQEDPREDGIEIWSLMLRVEQDLEGRFAGAVLWDRLVFGGTTPQKQRTALSRVKLVCSHLGLQTKGQVELLQHHLVDRKAWVETCHDEYKGQTKSRIAFAGYRSVEEGPGAEVTAPPKPPAAADVPF